MSPAIQSLVDRLQLSPHPEGGFYRETYRSEASIAASALPGYPGSRSHATAIYFLLTAGNFSAFHRIRQDEAWHFYLGDPIEVVAISPEGALSVTTLGQDLEAGHVPQYVVPGGHWFASRVKGAGQFGLTGCTVAPGFDFEDFEMADRQTLTAQFPQYADWIQALTR